MRIVVVTNGGKFEKVLFDGIPKDAAFLEAELVTYSIKGIGIKAVQDPGTVEKVFEAYRLAKDATLAIEAIR